MSGVSRAFFRLLLRCQPRAFRAALGGELESAAAACVARERARFGAAGVLYAWARLAADALTSAVLIRFDQRRVRRIAAMHAPDKRSRETAMTRLWQDFRFAGRAAQRAPVFSAMVIVTLALAIGATTAVFTVVNAVLLRSLPYHEPERLVMVYEGFVKAPAPIGFSPPDYVAFAERAGFFESIAAFRNREYELSGTATPERITAVRASAALFDTLGVRPAIGAAFTASDDAAGRPVAVISDALWERHFARSPDVVGRALMLDRQPYTITGVMPRGFTFPNRGPHLNNLPADVFLPINFTARERVAFGSMYNSSVVARLKPGVTADQANRDAAALAGANARELYPAPLRGLSEAISASATPLQDEIVGRTKTLLLVAFGAVSFVLLIACADIASLMLTRAAARQREMAVRSALGAGRGRIIRQLLAESAVLAIAGGVLGLLVARWLAGAIVAFAPATLPRLHEVGIDGRILAFTAAVSFITAMLCGLLPAVELSRRDTGDALKEGGRTGTAGRRQRRVFDTLVAAQVALAVVLLIGGGLLVRSFGRLMAVDAGFRAERVLTLVTSLPVSGYRTAPEVRSFYTRLLEAARSLPGISAAAVATDLPLGIRERRVFTIENESAGTRELPHAVAAQWIHGDYFPALGIALKRGRAFTEQDVLGSEPVVVINETMARQFWGDTDPVGLRMAWGTGPNNRGPWMRVIGVAADVKQSAVNVPTMPHTYVPYLQVSDGMVAENIVGQMRGLKLAVRTEMDEKAIAASVREKIRALDPALPVTAVQTMEDVVRTSAATERFNAMLVGLFALLALLLAAIGIGGVLATSVSRRTQEIGLRLALGAQRPALLTMVLRQGMLPAVIGLVLGLFIALRLVGRVMSSLLFEVKPIDPVTFGSVAMMLVAVAVVSCLIPAWRATRIDPMVALRRE